MNSEKEALDLPAIVTGNGEAYPKQWLAVYVRLYHEKKTSARLNTMGKFSSDTRRNSSME